MKHNLKQRCKEGTEYVLGI